MRVLRHRPHRRATRRAPGFTLVELMVVLAIAGVLLLMATPNFTTFVRDAELASAARGLVASLHAARSEAMKRNLPALVMPLEPGRRDWSRGFVAFVDTDRDGRSRRRSCPSPAPAASGPRPPTCATMVRASPGRPTTAPTISASASRGPMSPAIPPSRRAAASSSPAPAGCGSARRPRPATGAVRRSPAMADPPARPHFFVPLSLR